MAVNFVMAGFASSTFGGVVVDNSYVASQRFNGWLDQARVQAGLGWSAKASRLADGRVVLTFSGTPGTGLTVTAVARHPLGRMPDAALTFVREADGRFVSTAPLPLGALATAGFGAGGYRALAARSLTCHDRARAPAD